MQLGSKNIKIGSSIMLVLIAVIIYLLPNIQTGWLLNSSSYTDLGVYLFGGMARILVYISAIIMGIGVLAWIPKRRYDFTRLGERTLYVYLLHGFFIQLFRYYDFFRV